MIHNPDGDVRRGPIDFSSEDLVELLCEWFFGLRVSPPSDSLEPVVSEFLR